MGIVHSRFDEERKVSRLSVSSEDNEYMKISYVDSIFYASQIK